MKEYPIVCPSCNGSKWIPNTDLGFTDSTTKVCPACNGTGVVICKES